MKLEATYSIPYTLKYLLRTDRSKHVLVQYSKTSVVEQDFTTLLGKEDVYAGKGSGFTLSCIGGLLLGVYKYTPIGGSSYLPLPTSITNKKSVNVS